MFVLQTHCVSRNARRYSEGSIFRRIYVGLMKTKKESVKTWRRRRTGGEHTPWRGRRDVGALNTRKKEWKGERDWEGEWKGESPQGGEGRAWSGNPSSISLSSVPFYRLHFPRKRSERHAGRAGRDNRRPT